MVRRSIVLFAILFASCSGDESSGTGPCDDVACDEWEVCNGETGQCELEAGRCAGDDDCLTGYVCNADTHTCEAAQACFTNADCTDPEYPKCVDGACVAETVVPCEGVVCDEWEVCNGETGQCELEAGRCAGDDDCLTGYVCNADTHTCEAAQECFTNADCTDPDTPVCKDGACIPLYETDYCTVDFDCAANAHRTACVDNRCAVRDCTPGGYECAWNTNNHYFCNESNQCEEPTYVRDVVHDVVMEIMSRLDTTEYRTSNYVVDVEGGELRLDCSYWVKQVIERVSREHYDELPKNSSSLSTALAADYFKFFEAIRDGNYQSDLWEVVPNISEARAGDIIVYQYGDDNTGSTTGHVMIIMSTPVWSTCEDDLQHWVWVSDSANSGHAEDTRDGVTNYPGSESFEYDAKPGTNGEPSGVGIGKMWFNTGSSPYYRWSSCSGTQNFIPILIGRMVKKSS